MASEQPQSPSIPAEAAPAKTVRPDSLIIGGVIGAFRNRGFTLCLGLLVVTLVGYQLLAKATGLRPVKEPVPPQKPLRQLDRAKLEPYVLAPGGAADIKPEILDSLGTREYIQWTLEDKSATDPAERYVHCFVTYYTDDPGQVPHVPEECYSGNGYSAIDEELIEVPITDLNETVAFKLLTFERSAFLGRESRLVMYTFHTNGRFAPDRHVVRTVLKNPRDKHAYFSKVEISFGTAEIQPSREKAIEAGRKFLQKVIPVLVRDHWPDWEKIEGQTTETARAG
jgi:hypothetical protein